MQRGQQGALTALFDRLASGYDTAAPVKLCYDGPERSGLKFII